MFLRTEAVGEAMEWAQVTEAGVDMEEGADSARVRANNLEEDVAVVGAMVVEDEVGRTVSEVVDPTVRVWHRLEPHSIRQVNGRNDETNKRKKIVHNDRALGISTKDSGHYQEV
jgi:hypothetical protein